MEMECNVTADNKRVWGGANKNVLKLDCGNTCKIL